MTNRPPPCQPPSSRRVETGHQHPAVTMLGPKNIPVEFLLMLVRLAPKASPFARLAGAVISWLRPN